MIIARRIAAAAPRTCTPWAASSTISFSTCRRRSAESGVSGLEVASSANKTSRRVPAERAMFPSQPSEREVAMPRPPPNVPKWQAPNYPTTWSASQNPRANAMRGPRFEQTNMDFQPTPVSAMELILDEPIRLVEQRIASCDGGGGSLGHPKVFINLDKPGPKACGYCGLRFERTHHAHGADGHDKTPGHS